MNIHSDMHNFFVSYATEDFNWADWVSRTLEQAGYSVLMDRKDIEAGNNWVTWINRALETCEALIVILTSNYNENKAPYAMSEFSSFFANRETMANIIPIRMQDCKPLPIMASTQWIDLVGRDPNNGAEEILLQNIGKRGFRKGHPHDFHLQESPVTATSAPTSAYPGDRPDIWNLKAPRNLYFTGRKQLSAELIGALDKNVPVVLYGPHGIGKTQMALDYVYSNLAKYDTVWWVRGDNVLGGLTELAKALQGRSPLPFSDALHTVRTNFRLRDRWLLIIDNATPGDDVATVLDIWDSSQRRGNILVTGQSGEWDRRMHIIPVGEFTEDEAVEFLTKSAPNAGDENSAREVAAELGALPIALEGAIAYLKRRSIKWGEYLKEFRTLQRILNITPDLIKKYFPARDEQANDLYASWMLNFNAAAETPGAHEFLKLMSFFAPGTIPLTALKANLELLPPPLRIAFSKDGAFDPVREALTEYSLVDAHKRGPTLSIGKLVHLVARTLFAADDERNTFALSALRILNSAFPSLGYPEDYEEWSTCATLLPHALAAAELVDDLLRVMPELRIEAGDLLTKCGLYLLDRGAAKDAARRFEQVIELDRLQGSSLSESRRLARLARDHNNLGWAKKDAGDLQGARECFELALKGNLDALGPNDPTVATTLHNLGWTLMDLRDLEAARAKFLEAREIDIRNFGESDSNLARDWTDLAQVQSRTGDFFSAKENFEKALQIHRAAYRSPEEMDSVIEHVGDSLPPRRHIFSCANKRLARGLCRDYSHLGETCKALDKLDEAIAYFRRALEVGREALGADNATAAKHHRQLGIALKEAGQHEAAMADFKEALRIDTAEFTSGGRILVEDHLNLALLLRQQRSLGRANEHAQKALKIELEQCERTARSKDRLSSGSGTSHSENVARARIEIGWILKDSADFDQAQKMFQSALDCLGKLPRTESTLRREAEAHSGLAWAIKDEAYLRDLDEGGREMLASLERAKAHFRFSLEKEREAAGGIHQQRVAKALVGLGWVCKDRGEKDEAIENFEEALVIYFWSAGPSHEDTASTVNALVDVLKGRVHLE